MAQCPKCGKAVEMVGDYCDHHRSQRAQHQKSVELHARYRQSTNRYHVVKLKNTAEWVVGQTLTLEELGGIIPRTNIDVFFLGME